MKVDIQKAETVDHEVLTNVMRESKAFWGYSAEQLEKWKEVLTITAKYVLENKTYKLCQSNQIIGFYSFIHTGENLKLDNLFISPNHMRKGFGKLLIDDFLQKSKSIPSNRIILESDPNAEEFYKRQNFKTIALQKTSIKNRFMPIMVWMESQVDTFKLFDTKRLYVRHLKDSDIDEFYKIQSNKNVMKFIKPEMDFEESKKELSRFIGYYDEQNIMFKIWALIEKKTNKFIGICGIYLNDKYETEIAYRLQESKWGKGYGMEIAKELVNFCFTTLEYDKLYAYVREDNLGSRKILDRIMNYQGKMKVKNMNLIDHIYSIEKKAGYNNA